MANAVETLGELLRDVHRGLLEATRNVVHDHGLSAPGMRVMGHVMERPGTTVSELSRERRSAKSHVSRAVDSMVEAGFIEKRPDASDQRLARLYPTQKARDHFDSVRAAVHRRMTEVLSALSDDQMKAVLDGLVILRTALKQETSQPDRS